MTAKSKWIYLPVEVKNREFDGRLLLACCATERNYNVIIGKKNALARSYEYLPRGMIIDKAISAFREKQLNKLKSCGFRITVSDEESIGIYREPEIFLDQRMSKNTLNIIDFFFSWGPEQTKLIQNKYPSFAGKILTTGSPRLDITNKVFHQIYSESVNLLRKKYGRYILFPSNFSEIVNLHGGMAYQLSIREKQNAFHTEDNRLYYKGFLTHLEKTLANFTNVVPDIAKAFPDHKLIIRPHPGEDPLFWKNIARDIDNITVIHEGNVIPWLLAADCMFHQSCTTGLEAYLLGIPGIAYHPFYDSLYDNHISTRIGPIVTNKDDLINLIKKTLTGNELQRDDLSWFDNYLTIDKNMMASEKILDAISNIELCNDSLCSINRIPVYCKNKIIRFITMKLRKIKNRIKNEQPVLTTGTRKWPYTTVEDMENSIKILQGATGRFSDIKVKKLTGQMFLLYKNIIA